MNNNWELEKLGHSEVDRLLVCMAQWADEFKFSGFQLSYHSVFLFYYVSSAMRMHWLVSIRDIMCILIFREPVQRMLK
jgi:hypothetical protein